MAERWQQWMPFHIDRWRGSAYVQAMRAAARAGYLYLLGSAWQTDDCCVPDDDEELTVLSGLTGEEWQQFGATIRKRFVKTEKGLRNEVQFEEWNTAKRTFEKNHGSTLSPEELSEVKSRAGKAGAKKRWHDHGKSMAEPKQTDSTAIAKDGLQMTDTSTYTKATTKTTAIAVMNLPDWVDREVWNAYLEMRKKKRATPTDRALKGILTQLGIFRNKGHDPNAILDTSIRSNWTDVYEPKTGASNENKRTDAASERKRTSDDAIQAAVARRLGVNAGTSDAAGEGLLPKPDTPGGDTGRVPAGVGGDSSGTGDGAFRGRTLEGTAQ